MAARLALTVDARGAVLEKGTHQTLVLEHPGGRRERVGLRVLGSVVLHGNIKLSTDVLQALAAHDVSVTFLPTGRQATAIRLSPLPDQHVRLRHSQHLAYADHAVRLDIARRVVLAKLESMAKFFREFAPERESGMYRAMQAASQSSDVSGLLGVEGAATACHFEGLTALYERNGPPRFNGRSRRPPRDEPNALMSLAYTMAEGQVRQLVLRAGLDLQLGFLHAMSHRRQSLVLDLIEPARAELDQWVYALLIQRRVISPDMFVQEASTGSHLTKKGREAFYAAWFREGCRSALRPARALLATMLTSLRAIPASNGHSVPTNY